MMFFGEPDTGWFTDGRNLVFVRKGVEIVCVQWADLPDLVQMALEVWVNGGGKPEDLIPEGVSFCDAARFSQKVT